MREYTELRSLKASGSIKGEPLPAAQAWFQQLGWIEETPTPAQDRDLLARSQAAPDPLPLLCLRCRVSHPLEAWLRATHTKHRESYGLELAAMASYCLDDTGSLSIRTGANSQAPFNYAEIASSAKGLISPFSAEVLRTYDPSKCGLPHWARLKLQCHNELKAYFREHGLLLISDWALLRNTSAKRIRECWQSFARVAMTAEAAVGLHQRFAPLYDRAMQDYKASTGKASGWRPDAKFLIALAPEQDTNETEEQLIAIARAVRELLSGRWQQPESQLLEGSVEAAGAVSTSSEEDGGSSQELLALIHSALQRSLDQHMPAALTAKPKDEKLLRCLWKGWAEGLSNRPLADRCGTSCGTVSKKLRPTDHATTIATAAAVELRRHPAFVSCTTSAEAAERLVEGLRNHLLNPEREGEVAPIRRWIQQYLNQP